MTELVVKELEGIIQGVDEELVFVEMAEDLNGAQAFARRPKIPMLKEESPVDVVALLFQFKDKTWGSYEIFGIRTKKGKVIYDLTEDNSKIVPYLVSEAKDLFPKARELLYKK